MANNTSSTPDAATSSERSPPMERYYLVLFQSGERESAIGTINRTLARRIRLLLDQRISTPRCQTGIDLWIESPGGDANAAYKMYLSLRNKCREFRIVIPDYAKSAASLLALGADELFMGPEAELGPLDVQIGHPDREGVTVSGLDVANALDFLANFAQDYLVVGGSEVIYYTGLSRSEVLREFSHFAAQFLRPAIEKLDPHLVHRATNELKIAEKYAICMLQMRNKPRDVATDTELARHLVSGYPAHDFVISRGEAEDLGLPVRCSEDYNKWGIVRLIHDNYLFERQSSPVLMLLNEQELNNLMGSGDDEAASPGHESRCEDDTPNREGTDESDTINQTEEGGAVDREASSEG